MNIFKKGDYLHITFSDGTAHAVYDCSDDDWNFILNNRDNETALRNRFAKEDLYSGKLLIEKVKNSNILELRGASVYMLDVSELSIPEDFIAKIIQAEEENDQATISKFKNFWTLVSLNPDSRVRNNLFWFIRKWDMNITESGLIIAYRNADLKKEAKYSSEDTKAIINAFYQEKYINHTDPSRVTMKIGNKNRTISEMYNEIINGADSPIYTDCHSHTTTIKLGQPVRIPREECDSDQEHSCSSGLHVGAKGWLSKGYFGNVGLMVLVNPANVVAVPTIDEYGKMRTCEYFPIAIIDFDESGNIIEPPYSLYNDIAYLKELKYDGSINNVDYDNYEISNVYNNREDVYDSILARLNADR